MEDGLNNQKIVEVPKNIEAEQCVLGSILIDGEKILPQILDVLSSECFYDELNAKIFSIISAYYMENNSKVDPVGILSKALDNGIFEEELAGNNYLANLMSKVPSIANVMNYCNIVLEKYNLRKLLNLSQKINEEVQSNKNSQTILENLAQEVFNIRQGNNNGGLVHIGEIMLSAYDRLEKISGLQKEKYRGLSTGFPQLDNKISGLNKSDLLIVAARPGMGKTSFALNIASYVAMHTDKQVAIFSLEMSSEQLALRILSSEALVDSHMLRTGNIQPDDWIKIGYGTDRIRKSNMYIDDTAGITVQTIKSRLQIVKNLGLVVIDYLQLMSSNLHSDNRVTVISEITRNVKILAKDLDVPIILLSQLSRAPENRTDKRPMLSDLRESGSIEQDADIVIFLYRDSYYNPASEDKFISECIVAKNRHGETGTVKLGWNGAFTKFTNVEHNMTEPN